MMPKAIAGRRTKSRRNTTAITMGMSTKKNLTSPMATETRALTSTAPPSTGEICLTLSKETTKPQAIARKIAIMPLAPPPFGSPPKVPTTASQFLSMDMKCWITVNGSCRIAMARINSQHLRKKVSSIAREAVRKVIAQTNRKCLPPTRMLINGVRFNAALISTRAKNANNSQMNKGIGRRRSAAGTWWPSASSGSLRMRNMHSM